MSIVTRNRISDIVVQFSTGGEAPYYRGVEHWFYSLLGGLKVTGVRVLSECPEFPQAEGDGRLIVTNGKEEMYIYYTFYRMQSGRWEVICYLT